MDFYVELSEPVNPESRRLLRQTRPRTGLVFSFAPHTYFSEKSLAPSEEAYVTESLEDGRTDLRIFDGEGTNTVTVDMSYNALKKLREAVMTVGHELYGKTLELYGESAKQYMQDFKSNNGVFAPL